ncbi:MAG: hypothetical protein JSV23_10500 [Promethearchaeota archaeon]|nr:MAG: hypothetical protein JSV23_10500 [Candidatus Lokiarchaeota archaeon]
MVNFILLIENISKYSKRDIDLGKTPFDVYRLCNCIRETFCLSYSIRKENNLYLYFQKEHVLIKFEGTKLRYLGPDERSQTLLLEKALSNTKKESFLENEQWKKSTPGIFFRKFFDDSSFITFYKSLRKGKTFLMIDHPQNVEEKVEDFNFEFIENMEVDFFIIPFYSKSRDKHKIIELFKEVKNIKPISLSKIKEVENKILYINFRKDQQ